MRHLSVVQVDGVAFPPLVPVVAANVVTLLLNLYQAMAGNMLGGLTLTLRSLTLAC